MEGRSLCDYQDSTVTVMNKPIDLFQKFLTLRPRIERKEVNMEVIREFSSHRETKRKVSYITHGKRMRHCVDPALEGLGR